jgi:hypothetical protein
LSTVATKTLRGPAACCATYFSYCETGLFHPMALIALRSPPGHRPAAPLIAYSEPPTE